jgi:hypothetical protein
MRQDPCLTLLLAPIILHNTDEGLPDGSIYFRATFSPEFDSAMSSFGLIIIVGVDALPQGPVSTSRTPAKDIAFRPFTFGCWSLTNGCRRASEGRSATKLIALCLRFESM